MTCKGFPLIQESILLWQRKCEDALYSLLTLGARRPVRHLASVAMARIISKGDGISIYSRASTLQGFLSDGKRTEPQRIAGWSNMLNFLTDVCTAAFDLLMIRMLSSFMDSCAFTLLPLAVANFSNFNLSSHAIKYRILFKS